MPVQDILDRLEKVRKSGPGRWAARCPHHDDKAPSLSIREEPDGKILLHCFAGCGAAEVVGAIGMDLSDLFPPSDAKYSGPVKARLISPGQALDIISQETLLVWTAAQNLAQGYQLTPDDLKRLGHAATRIQAVIKEARGMTYKDLGALADRVASLQGLTLSDQDPGFLDFLATTNDVALLQSADEFGLALLERMFESPQIVGPACRLRKLDDKVRFPPGQVTLWYGYNGHGKSLITSQVALDLALVDEYPLICSFEMTPIATLHRMVKQSAGSASPSRQWAQAFLQWAQGRVWIYNQRELSPSTKLLDLCLYAAKRLEVRQIFIDSLMKCVKGEEDYDGQKEFVAGCCRLAVAANVHVHLVHHVRKGQDESAIPGKNDAKGSGSISDQVDCAIGVWRNKKKEIARQAGKPVDDLGPDAILNIDKNRHIEWEGRVGLDYIAGAQAYTDVRAPIRYRELEDWLHVE